MLYASIKLPYIIYQNISLQLKQEKPTSLIHFLSKGFSEARAVAWKVAQMRGYYYLK